MVGHGGTDTLRPRVNGIPGGGRPGNLASLFDLTLDENDHKTL